MENNLALNEVYLPDPFEVLGALINILLYPLTLPFMAMPQLQLQLPATALNYQSQLPPKAAAPIIEAYHKNSISPKTTYANTEEWELQRDEDGRLEAIVIHRKATRSE